MPSSIRVDHNNRRINAANLQSRLANGRSLDAALRLPAVGPRGCGRTKDSAEKEPRALFRAPLYAPAGVVQRDTRSQDSICGLA
ncbi:hypothetical protein V1477_002826 [Vespula maculifrons]|uniref:Uncharacterized protein n=1 Tax=Vespula maculifrons TaxID=7453 RepID=A0ABD2CUU7_VESMC